MAKTRHTNSSVVSPTPIKKKAKEKEMAIPTEVTKAEIQHICRTCLEEIQESGLIPLNDSSSNIRNELRACIPEVDFDLVPNAGMCTYCLNALHVAYEFKQKCLQTEDKIRKQLHRKLLVDLTKLKKPNMVQIYNGNGLGLDVVYINDPINIIDDDIEEINPFTGPNTHISTPLLDEEIEMINSFVNINNDDRLNGSLSPIEEIIPNQGESTTTDEEVDEDVSMTEDNCDNKQQESNLLLGLSESAPRKISTKVKQSKRFTPIGSTRIALIESIKTAASTKSDTPVELIKPYFPNSLGRPYVNLVFPNKVFVCSICKDAFKNSTSYVLHVKEHTQQRRFHCPGCKFVSYHIHSFVMHLKSCIKRHKVNIDVLMSQYPSKYKCTKCKFETSILFQYKKHMRNCVESVPALKRPSARILKKLKININAEHLEPNTKNLVKDSPPPLKKVRTKSPINVVIKTKNSDVKTKTDTKTKNEDTKIKNETNAKKDDVKIKNDDVKTKHEPSKTKHNDTKNRSDEKFKNDEIQIKNNEIMMEISLLFEDINKLDCRFCDFSTYDIPTFEVHNSDKHETDNPYSCKDKKCPFVARHKVGIVAHMKQHVGDRRYRCDICSYQSAKKASLVNHSKRHINVLPPKPKKWNRSYF